MNIIDKKLPIINISLSWKKSVFGNEFFNNNNKYFKYDYYNNLKINERLYSNNKKNLEIILKMIIIIIIINQCI